MKLKAAPYSALSRLLYLRTPQELKKTTKRPLPGLTELLPILVTPSYIATGVSTSTASEEMGGRQFSAAAVRGLN